MTTDTFSMFFALLTVAANLFVVAALGLWVAARRSPAWAARLRGAAESLRPSAIGFAWVAAAVATAGSLYYSEVAHFTPCRLCWYQRIAMYPMTLLLGVAWIKRDASIRRFALPLAIAGALLSIYHYQLERFPAQSTVSCDLEAPCTLVWIWKFHYISIPFMALSAFALIAVLMLTLPRRDPDMYEEIIDEHEDGRTADFATEGAR